MVPDSLRSIGSSIPLAPERAHHASKDAGPARPGIGVALWMHATDVQAIHDELAADGHTIVTAPFDGQFGSTFTFADPDGYHVTLHDRA